MTTRHSGYQVTLADDIREDDAEALITALRMLKGVIAVQPIEADYNLVIASHRRDREWGDRLRQLLREMDR